MLVKSLKNILGKKSMWIVIGYLDVKKINCFSSHIAIQSLIDLF